MEPGFYFEKPIDYIKEDKYGFDKHAITVSKTLLQMPLHESYTLSINGEWGSGKTSFVNLIICHLKEAIELDNEKIIIINFDTSLFQNSNEMISEYFKQVLSILNKERKINKSYEFQKLVKSFIAYGDKVSLSFESLSSENNFFVKIWKNIKSIYEIWFNKTDIKLTLQELKINLSERLTKSKYRFIVVIDDMDRLPKNQVRNIFQLIYSLCKLPNHTFLLPFDKRIVSKCINGAYGIKNGESYIEKIIQREINVPEIYEQKIKENLFSTIRNAKIEIDYSENEYIEKGYKICIKPLITNIRDLNRLCDNFIFSSNLTMDKINQFDLLLLTSIKMKFPNLYRYISDNRYRVTLSDKTDALEKKERKDWGKLKTEFSEYEINEANQLIAKKILDFLFPNFYLNYQGKKEENIYVATLEHKHHIKDSNYISVFFSPELDEDIITFTEIKNLLFNDNKKIFEFLHNQINKKESILNQIDSFISEEEIEPSRLFEIAKAFSCLYEKDSNVFRKKDFSIFETAISKIESDLDKYLSELINSEDLINNKTCITEYLVKIHDYVLLSGESALNENDYFNLRLSLFDKLSKLNKILLFDSFYPNCFFNLYQNLKYDNSNSNMNQNDKDSCEKDLNTILNNFMNEKHNLLGFIMIYRENWQKAPKGILVSDLRKQYFPEITNIDKYAIQFAKEYLASNDYENDISQNLELFIDSFI